MRRQRELTGEAAADAREKAVEQAVDVEHGSDAVRGKAGRALRLHRADLPVEFRQGQHAVIDGDVGGGVERLAERPAFSACTAGVAAARRRREREIDHRLIDDHAAGAEACERRAHVERGASKAPGELAGSVDSAGDLRPTKRKRPAGAGFNGKVGVALHNAPCRAGTQLGAIDARVLNGDAAVLIGEARIERRRTPKQLSNHLGRAIDVCAAAGDGGGPDARAIDALGEGAPFAAGFAGQKVGQRFKTTRAPFAGELAVAAIDPALRGDGDRFAG